MSFSIGDTDWSLIGMGDLFYKNVFLLFNYLRYYPCTSYQKFLFHRAEEDLNWDYTLDIERLSFSDRYILACKRVNKNPKELCKNLKECRLTKEQEFEIARIAAQNAPDVLYDNLKNFNLEGCHLKELKQIEPYSRLLSLRDAIDSLQQIQNISLEELTALIEDIHVCNRTFPLPPKFLTDVVGLTRRGLEDWVSKSDFKSILDLLKIASRNISEVTEEVLCTIHDLLNQEHPELNLQCYAFIAAEEPLQLRLKNESIERIGEEKLERFSDTIKVFYSFPISKLEEKIQEFISSHFRKGIFFVSFDSHNSPLVIEKDDKDKLLNVLVSDSLGDGKTFVYTEEILKVLKNIPRPKKTYVFSMQRQYNTWGCNIFTLQDLKSACKETTLFSQIAAFAFKAKTNGWEYQDAPKLPWKMMKLTESLRFLKSFYSSYSKQDPQGIQSLETWVKSNTVWVNFNGERKERNCGSLKRKMKYYTHVLGEVLQHDETPVKKSVRKRDKSKGPDSYLESWF